MFLPFYVEYVDRLKRPFCICCQLALFKQVPPMSIDITWLLVLYTTTFVNTFCFLLLLNHGFLITPFQFVRTQQQSCCGISTYNPVLIMPAIAQTLFFLHILRRGFTFLRSLVLGISMFRLKRQRRFIDSVHCGLLEYSNTSYTRFIANAKV